MNLRELIFTENACFQAGQILRPRGIMVHSTGANNPTLRRYVGPDDGALGQNQYDNHWNRAKPEGRLVCPHAFIGLLTEGSIATYQVLPWTYRGWHCGQGKRGSANDTHISFEICEDALKDKEYFGLIYREAVELCVFLCGRYGLRAADIICHSEGYKLGLANNHADVMHWFPRFGKSMDTFRADVEKALAKPATDGLYRVRKSWVDARSQLGAFSILKGAMTLADANPGFTVYDSNGVAVYPVLYTPN